MALTFQALSDVLPGVSIEFVGNQQLKINFTELTQKALTLEDSCVEAIVKLMQGLATLTNRINEDRLKQNSSQIPIEFVSQDLVGTPDQPKFKFVLEVAVNTQIFANNLIDPTVELND